jgi:S-formylglutathione hydrolase FrmB
MTSAGEGVSMGGYGAVKLGLKHHEMFCSVHSQSGSLGVVHPGEPSRAKTLPFVTHQPDASARGAVGRRSDMPGLSPR